MTDILLEVCVDDAAGLEAAVEGGADRIELCAALSVGGLTPTVGLMRLAAQAPVPVFAMIRPRSGGFQVGFPETEVMRADIDSAGKAGLAGVVFGASMADNRLDEETLGTLVEQAGGMGKTLHRAIDLTPDPTVGVETAIALGFDRILTSGGKRTALEGIHSLKAMCAAAAGRISIMPGSGVQAGNVLDLVSGLPVTEIHASCSVAEDISDPALQSFGFSGQTERRTSARSVAELKSTICSFDGNR